MFSDKTHKFAAIIAISVVGINAGLDWYSVISGNHLLESYLLSSAVAWTVATYAILVNGNVKWKT